LSEAVAGAAAVEVCRRHGISETTFYRWKAKFGGLAASDAKRLRQVGAENSRLKWLLAEAHLDNAALKDLLARTGDARGSAADARAPVRGAPLRRATRVRAGRASPVRLPGISRGGATTPSCRHVCANSPGGTGDLAICGCTSC
jgi:putative transposase